MLKIKPNSRQIPSVQSITANKKYTDSFYGKLQELSKSEKNLDGTTTRYLLKSEATATALGAALNMSRQTASKKLKNLKELALIEETEDRLILKVLDKDLCSLVPLETLKVMTDVFNEYTISLYVYFLNRFIANQEKEFMVNMVQMKTFIGISTSSTSNNSIITNIMDILQKIGLIKYRRANEDNKTHIYISLVRNTIPK